LTTSAEYTEYVLELLEPIGPVRTGRFFGGVGISCGSVQFAMNMGNSLYFAVDEDSRKQYEVAYALKQDTPTAKKFLKHYHPSGS
jgi:DNA transformation protein